MTWRAGSFLRQGRNEAAESSVTLRLKSKKKVNWGTDVVDNEDMGKRKSNKCCIFHKRKKFGESSSESEYSDSGDESSMRSGGGGCAPPASTAARQVRLRHWRQRQRCGHAGERIWSQR